MAVKPSWLLAMMWMRAVGVVAGEPRQVQRLGDDALARERRRRRESGPAACWRRRSAARPARPRRVPAARAMPDDHRVHGLEVARVRHQRHEHLAARHRRAARRRGTSRRPSSRGRAAASARAIGSLNSARICAYGLSSTCASTFSRPRCAMPSSVWRVPMLGRAADDLVEHRHQHVEPFDREPRLAGEGPVQEALEHLDLGDAVEQRLASSPDPSAAGSGPTRRRRAATRVPRARTRAR